MSLSLPLLTSFAAEGVRDFRVWSSKQGKGEGEMKVILSVTYIAINNIKSLFPQLCKMSTKVVGFLYIFSMANVNLFYSK